MLMIRDQQPSCEKYPLRVGSTILTAVTGFTAVDVVGFLLSLCFFRRYPQSSLNTVNTE